MLKILFVVYLITGLFSSLYWIVYSMVEDDGSLANVLVRLGEMLDYGRVSAIIVPTLILIILMGLMVFYPIAYLVYGFEFIFKKISKRRES
ncbi:MAG TPA: hypothetical protein VJ962_11695 [Clostridia bacterium]|nr:hypothetical protein [Clostridia bacterium]